MKTFLRKWGVIAGFAGCSLIPVSAQQANTQTGLETPWDARKIVTNVVAADEQLKPILGAIDPKEWYEKKGAPSTYVIQWQTAQRQLGDVEVTAKLLSQQPESLSLALDMYFRLEALETTARSVDEGAQKYADRPTADRLGRVIAQNFGSRERLRDYIRDLASSTEQNFKIADEEAQRCRGIISKEPPPANSKRTRKN
ncbi:MAG: hypothetical protein M3Y72_26220 [Acidobacteriota bacterium]|nr:hypothetical protein [Acidobacteriota bacterium]